MNIFSSLLLFPFTHWVHCQLIVAKSKRQFLLASQLKDLSAQSKQLECSRALDIQRILSLLATMPDTISKDIIATKHEELQKAQEKARLISVEHRILQTLHFDRMFSRETAIAEAQGQTFSWIFEDSSTVFLSWLQEPGGTFWISGKPGSGKSTLMKFIFNNPKVEYHLKANNTDSPLCMARFYFWGPGTEMQRSQEGLFRFLLCQIFSKCPDLIAVLCPERWKRMSQSLDIFQPSSTQPQVWTMKELSRAFELLKDPETLGTLQNIRFCFFVDGLDEYKGDALQLVKTMKDIAIIPNIKLCLASRPWPCFADAFGLTTSKIIHGRSDNARY